MSNSKTVILVRTRLPWPDPTQISYRWAGAVKQHFEANGWRVLDLAVDDAVRENVENFLQSHESSVFLFYGHGLPVQMIGQDGIALINQANLRLLKNQKVYVVACWTAQILGPAAANIARCYLGYDGEVIVWFDEPYAAHLENCVNKGILAILNTPSCTIEQARQLIIDEYNHWIDHFTVGAGVFDFQSADFAADLRDNRDVLAQVFGDETATLTN